MIWVLAEKEVIEKKDETTSGCIDYNEYTMSNTEKLMYSIVAVVSVFIVAYIFYHSFVLALLLSPIGLFYPAIRKKEIIKKRKNELTLQFKDMLFSLSSSLSAGKSVEMAFRNVLSDLSIVYPDPDTYILRETEYIIRKISMNETVEEALSDFSDRAHLEDIDDFVDVFRTCKRTGGNLIDVIRNTSNIINDKIMIGEEINTILSEKKFEQKVLNVIPILMVLFLTLSADDYMEPLFNSIIGRLAMTASIGLLIIAYFVSKKITDIKI